MAVVQLQFQKDVKDPLKPLKDDVADGKLGSFNVVKQLDLIKPSMSRFRDAQKRGLQSVGPSGSSCELPISVANFVLSDFSYGIHSGPGDLSPLVLLVL